MGDAALVFSGYDVCAVISLILSSIFIIYQFYFAYYVWSYTGGEVVNLLMHITYKSSLDGVSHVENGRRRSPSPLNLAVFQRKFEGFLLIGLPLLACFTSFILILVAIRPPNGETNQEITNPELRYRGTYIAALVMSCISLVPFVLSFVLSCIFPSYFSAGNAWGSFTGAIVPIMRNMVSSSMTDYLETPMDVEIANADKRKRRSKLKREEENRLLQGRSNGKVGAEVDGNFREE